MRRKIAVLVGSFLLGLTLAAPLFARGKISCVKRCLTNNPTWTVQQCQKFCG